MLRFLDQAYKNADKALGGWLPAGGTANPLSDAVRPVLETINPNDPSVSNYYRENRDTAREQGKAALREANDISGSIEARANDAARAIGPDATAEQRMNAYDTVYQSEESQEQQAQIRELYTRARRHGVGAYHDLLPDASDREAVLYNRANADLSAAQIESLTARTLFGDVDPDVERQRIVEQDKIDSTRIDNVERGSNLAETVTNSFGLDTSDGPNNGSLSCVYGVNKIIEGSGIEVPWKDPETGANSVYIPFVENWITSNGGSVVSAEEAKPGDIISDGGHMGILTDQVDDNGQKIVLSNSSSRASMTYKYPLTGQRVYRVPQLQGN
jgi:hypothetical protein